MSAHQTPSDAAVPAGPAGHRLRGAEAASTRWVFGYGSLIWRVDFPYRQRRRAWITGWTRRFWQGSHDHRGTPDAPGRVVTLLPDPRATCIGMAYRVDEPVFAHLDDREKNGYERIDVNIHFDTGTVEGTVYVAGETNPAFLGAAPLDDLAAHILRSRGPSGSNIDYLLRLNAALDELGVEDGHVAALAARVASGPDERAGAVAEGIDWQAHRPQQRHEQIG